MALWQLINKDGIAHGEQFDDGLAYRPGEDGFSTEAVAARASELGKDYSFSLIGVPNWHLRIEAEQKAASDKEEVERLAKEEADLAIKREADKTVLKETLARQAAQIADPQGFARAQALASIEADHASIAEVLGDDPEAMAHAATIKAAQIAAVMAGDPS